MNNLPSSPAPWHFGFDYPSHVATHYPDPWLSVLDQWWLLPPESVETENRVHEFSTAKSPSLQNLAKKYQAPYWVKLLGAHQKEIDGLERQPWGVFRDRGGPQTKPVQDWPTTWEGCLELPSDVFGSVFARFPNEPSTLNLHIDWSILMALWVARGGQPWQDVKRLTDNEAPLEPHLSMTHLWLRHARLSHWEQAQKMPAWPGVEALWSLPPSLLREGVPTRWWEQGLLALGHPNPHAMQVLRYGMAQVKPREVSREVMVDLGPEAIQMLGEYGWLQVQPYDLAEVEKVWVKRTAKEPKWSASVNELRLWMEVNKADSSATTKSSKASPKATSGLRKLDDMWVNWLLSPSSTSVVDAIDFRPMLTFWLERAREESIARESSTQAWKSLEDWQAANPPSFNNQGRVAPALQQMASLSLEEWLTPLYQSNQKHMGKAWSLLGLGLMHTLFKVEDDQEKGELQPLQLFWNVLRYVHHQAGSPTLDWQALLAQPMGPGLSLGGLMYLCVQQHPQAWPNQGQYYDLQGFNTAMSGVSQDHWLSSLVLWSKYKKPEHIKNDPYRFLPGLSLDDERLQPYRQEAQKWWEWWIQRPKNTVALRASSHASPGSKDELRDVVQDRLKTLSSSGTAQSSDAQKDMWKWVSDNQTQLINIIDVDVPCSEPWDSSAQGLGVRSIKPGEACLYRAPRGLYRWPEDAETWSEMVVKWWCKVNSADLTERGLFWQKALSLFEPSTLPTALKESKASLPLVMLQTPCEQWGTWQDLHLFKGSGFGTDRQKSALPHLPAAGIVHQDAGKLSPGEKLAWFRLALLSHGMFFNTQPWSSNPYTLNSVNEKNPYYTDPVWESLVHAQRLTSETSMSGILQALAQEVKTLELDDMNKAYESLVLFTNNAAKIKGDLADVRALKELAATMEGWKLEKAWGGPQESSPKRRGLGRF